MVNAQEWLNKEYPKEKRSKVRKIELAEPNLVGELDLSDFTSEYGVKVFISPFLDKTKLVFKNSPEWVEIIEKSTCSYDTLKSLTKEEKIRIEVLDLSEQNLEGTLNLNEFINLKRFYCSSNRLTKLDLTNCEKLEGIEYYYNHQLTTITLPTNPTSLKKLYLSSNNFNQDLSFLSKVINLEELDLSYNKFIGSLDYLSNLPQLKGLIISNTDINEVNINKLPRSLEYTSYSTDYRPDCKLTEIVPLLEKNFGKFNRCPKCQQPNTSYKWCQPCFEKEWSQDLKQSNRQELIKRFIKQQQSRENKKFDIIDDLKYETKLWWIPYDEFANIEYLAEGGFSKIYKAKCKEIKKY